ncbi:MAG: ATP-binding protein [Pseudonocardia sp.]|nr:ATP-binding protein [Pseudonocardia sp.]
MTAGDDDGARRGTPPRSDRLRIRLLGVPAAASLVRERLRRWLDGLGWPEPQLDDVVLAVHEAVTNSVEHGYGGTDAGDVEIVGTRLVDGGMQSARIVVRDAGRWRAPRDPGYRGHGLTVMRACMAQVEVRAGAAGTEVELLSVPVPVTGHRTPAPLSVAAVEVRSLVWAERPPGREHT